MIRLVKVAGGLAASAALPVLVVAWTVAGAVTGGLVYAVLFALAMVLGQGLGGPLALPFLVLLGAVAGLLVGLVTVVAFLAAVSVGLLASPQWRRVGAPPRGRRRDADRVIAGV